MINLPGYFCTKLHISVGPNVPGSGFFMTFSGIDGGLFIPSCPCICRLCSVVSFSLATSKAKCEPEIILVYNNLVKLRNHQPIITFMNWYICSIKIFQDTACVVRGFI